MGFGRMVIVLLAGLWLAAAPARAAEKTFEVARSLAFKGDRKGAIALCREILKTCPRCQDVRTLLGRVLAWEKQYPAARAELLKVLGQNGKNKDAQEALTDIALWQKRPLQALALADASLRRQANHAPFWLQKARAHEALQNERAALAAALRALQLDPALKAAQALFSKLKQRNPVWKLSVGYTLERFDSTFTPWRASHYSLSRKTPLGTVLLNVNHASRFGREASQFGLEAYPHLARKLYAYVGYARGGKNTYPLNTLGVELFSGHLPRSEVSLGLRRLGFSGNATTFYTASLTHYPGQWLLGYRAYYTPKDVGYSLSQHMKVGWLFKRGGTSLTLSGGVGRSPDDRPSVLNVQNLKSRSWGLGAETTLGKWWSLGGGWTHEREEFLPGRYRGRNALNVTVSQHF